MELEAFAHLLSECCQEESAVSLPAWKTVLKFRDEQPENYIMSYFTLVSSELISSAEQKMGLIILTHECEKAMKAALTSISLDVAGQIVTVLLSWCSSPDLALVQLSSEFAGYVFAYQIESTGEMGIVSPIFEGWMQTTNGSERLGYLNLLATVGRTVKIAAEIQQQLAEMAFLTVKSDLELPLKSWCLRVIRSLIPSLGEMIELVASELMAVTSDPATMAESFLCWETIIAKFPHLADSVFQVLAESLLAVLCECEMDEVLSAIFMFLRTYLKVMVNKDWLYSCLPALVEALVRHFARRDLTVTDTGRDSPPEMAFYLLISLGKGFREVVVEMLGPVGENFDEPILSLCSLSVLLRLRHPVGPEQLAFFLFCIGAEPEWVQLQGAKCLRRFCETELGWWDEGVFMQALERCTAGRPAVQGESLRLIAACSNRIPIAGFSSLLFSGLFSDSLPMARSAVKSMAYILLNVPIEDREPLVTEMLDICDSHETLGPSLRARVGGVLFSYFGPSVGREWPLSGDRVMAFLMKLAREDPSFVTTGLVIQLAVPMHLFPVQTSAYAPEVTELLYMFLTGWYHRKMAVHRASLCLGILAETFDLSHCAMAFFEAFITIFAECHWSHCLIGIRAIGRKFPELIHMHAAELCQIVDAVLESGNTEYLLEFLAVMIETLDPSQTRGLVSLGVGLHNQLRSTSPNCPGFSSIFYAMGEGNKPLVDRYQKANRGMVEFATACFHVLAPEDAAALVVSDMTG